MTPKERADVIDEAQKALHREQVEKGRALTAYEVHWTLERLKSSATSSPAQQPQRKK